MPPVPVVPVEVELLVVWPLDAPVPVELLVVPPVEVSPSEHATWRTLTPTSAAMHLKGRPAPGSLLATTAAAFFSRHGFSEAVNFFRFPWPAKLVVRELVFPFGRMDLVLDTFNGEM